MPQDWVPHPVGRGGFQLWNQSLTSDLPFADHVPSAGDVTSSVISFTWIVMTQRALSPWVWGTVYVQGWGLLEPSDH